MGLDDDFQDTERQQIITNILKAHRDGYEGDYNLAPQVIATFWFADKSKLNDILMQRGTMPWPPRSR